MKNFEAKGTGNSRFLKSAIPEGMTWTEALALLRAGTFPVDFAGFNPEGIVEQGTLLNKANLLQDRTAEALELTQADPTIDDALFALAQKQQFSSVTVKTLAGATVKLIGGGKTQTGTADSNGNATFRITKLGAYTVTCTANGYTWSQNVELVYYGLITVETIPELAQCDWALIDAISKAGKASTYFKVGDKKTIKINNVNYDVQIIGFNHDNLTAGGKAGITFQMVDCLATTYPMNSSNVNNTGWNNSAMRTTTLRTTIWGQLETSLKNVIKTVNKLTSAGNQSATIQTAQDTLFLLSEIEIFGTVTYSKAGEGSQYAWYAAGNSKIKKVNGSASYWWERSPSGGNAAAFCYVNSNGNANGAGASNSGGVAFGFCI